MVNFMVDLEQIGAGIPFQVKVRSNPQTGSIHLSEYLPCRQDMRWVALAKQEVDYIKESLERTVLEPLAD